MNIKEQQDFLVLKINSLSVYDFYEEHNNIIMKKGFVWFCKFGRTKLNVEKISKMSKYMFFIDSKKNNYNTYLVEISEVSNNEPIDCYPKYYDSINMEKMIWFKVKNIKKVSKELVIESFETKSSKGRIEPVLKSMCNSFYITSKKNIKV